VLLQSWANAELWFKKDDHFSTPKGNISLEITTNDLGFGKSPTARVFAQLWADCLKEYIFEFNFMAVSADLGFNLTLGNDTMQLQWNGFSDSLALFVKETITHITAMRRANIQPIFDQIKAQLLQ